MEYNFWFFYTGGMLAALIGLKSRNKSFFVLVACTAIFFVLSGCIPSTKMWNDLNNYKMSFNGLEGYYDIALANDWGFYNLIYFLKSTGLSFMESKAVLMMICILLQYRFLSRFSPNVRLFALFFYLMSLAFQTGLILRNSVGFAIALQGFLCLINENEEHGTLKYVLWVLLAAQFHSSLYILLIFVFTNFSLLRLKRYRKVIAAAIVAVAGVLIFLVRNGLVVTYLMSFAGKMLGSDKYVGYAVALGRYAWISVLLIWAMVLVTSLYFARKRTKANDVYRREEQLRLSRIILISSVFIPLVILTLHFYRFLHYLSVLYVVYMGVVFETSAKRSTRCLAFVCVLLVMLAWLVFEMFIYGGYSPEILNDYAIHGTWFWR